MKAADVSVVRGYEPCSYGLSRLAYTEGAINTDDIDCVAGLPVQVIFSWRQVWLHSCHSCKRSFMNFKDVEIILKLRGISIVNSSLFMACMNKSTCTKKKQKTLLPEILPAMQIVPVFQVKFILVQPTRIQNWY